MTFPGLKRGRLKRVLEPTSRDSPSCTKLFCTRLVIILKCYGCAEAESTDSCATGFGFLLALLLTALCEELNGL